MYKNLNLIVNELKDRREMFVFDNSYNSLSSFLIGYMCASEDINISKEFKSWLGKKKDVHSSLHWSSYIFNEFAKEKEEKACEILIELLQEFCEEKKGERDD